LKYCVKKNEEEIPFSNDELGGESEKDGSKSDKYRSHYKI